MDEKAYDDAFDAIWQKYHEDVARLRPERDDALAAVKQALNTEEVKRE